MLVVISNLWQGLHERESISPVDPRFQFFTRDVFHSHLLVIHRLPTSSALVTRHSEKGGLPQSEGTIRKTSSTVVSVILSLHRQETSSQAWLRTSSSIQPVSSRRANSTASSSRFVARAACFGSGHASIADGDSGSGRIHPLGGPE